MFCVNNIVNMALICDHVHDEVMNGELICVLAYWENRLVKPDVFMSLQK